MWYKPEGTSVICKENFADILEEVGFKLPEKGKSALLYWLDRHCIARVAVSKSGYVVTSWEQAVEDGVPPSVQMLRIDNITGEIQLIFITEVANGCCKTLLGREVSLQVSRFVIEALG